MRTTGLAAALALAPAAAAGWELASHEAAARVAARALPAEVPVFLREAVEELAYLCNEPDRWRGHVPWYVDRTTGQSGPRPDPVLRPHEMPNHVFYVERTAGPLPPSRYAFLFAHVRAGTGDDWKRTASTVGTAPYAIAEHAEVLTQSLRLWRQAPETTPLLARRRRQMERNVIQAAGLLCHYVTDTTQPLHATIHAFGWKQGTPNPRGYTPEQADIHGRFESYTDRLLLEGLLTEDELARRLAAPRAWSDWLPEAEAHLRRTHRHVERLYELDRGRAFWSGREPPAAREFVADRLAAGAEALRDVWLTAWQRSR